ncbi:MAG: nucleotidyl transferase AbiEii/AbiGii toxin family protein [Candidatus Baltobacteraceae bacterium]
MIGNLFLANDAERAFYLTRLYPLQNRILAIAGSYGQELVLTGGTALARCYFDHRFSDDIDLFHAGGHLRAMARDFAEALRHGEFDVAVRIDQAGFSRFMVGDGTTEVQVDLGADLPRVDAPVLSEFGVYAHTLREIGANKIVAFEDRLEAKDALDLYYLTQRLGWKEMVADADAKRVPLDYESLQRLVTQPLVGKALLSRPIDQPAFEAFLRDLRDQLALTIEKKTVESTHRLPTLIAELLWDAPRADRIIDAHTRPVLLRRAALLPVPERNAILAALS